MTLLPLSVLDDPPPRNDAVAALSTSALRDRVIDGLRAGRPVVGPQTVHIDVTNACNAACTTCWDHSPLLDVPRSGEWKGRRMPRPVFQAVVDDLDALGSVRHLIVSGMGEPLVHPDIYAMLQRAKAAGWELTVMTNLVAADMDRLVACGVDRLLVGVQGVTPDTYAAFHPGWSEREFFRLCRHLRRAARAGMAVRHVQVINRDLAPEVPAMVRFGHRFGADRVNFKLASLSAGTEACMITDAQRAWLLAEAVPQARALADELGVATTLDLFERQLRAGQDGPAPTATTPIEEIGCFMGYAYTRITVDGDVLYCCNTNVQVGSLADGPVSTLWYGERWQALREQLRAGDYLPGCERCGKFEQNVKWSARYKQAMGDPAWRDITGHGAESVDADLWEADS